MFRQDPKARERSLKPSNPTVRCSCNHFHISVNNTDSPDLLALSRTYSLVKLPMNFFYLLPNFLPNISGVCQSEGERWLIKGHPMYSSKASLCFLDSQGKERRENLLLWRRVAGLNFSSTPYSITSDSGIDRFFFVPTESAALGQIATNSLMRKASIISFSYYFSQCLYIDFFFNF